jgi:undecaprenyl-diphosphatase
VSYFQEKIAVIGGLGSESVADVIAYLNYLEGDICLRINQLSRRARIRRFFALVSKFGDGGFWALMGAIVLSLQGPAALPAIVQMATTGAVGVLLYKLLKNYLVRERPYINHFGILCAAAPLDRYSFPSGHTLHAVSFTMMLWHFEPFLLPVVLPFALLVAASRIILGLHYPSDVVVGAAIGVTLATSSLALIGA